MTLADPYLLLAERLAARLATIEVVVVDSQAAKVGARGLFDPAGKWLAGDWGKELGTTLASVPAAVSASRPTALVEPEPGLTVFVCRWAPPARLVIFGGGHVGRAIAALIPAIGLDGLVVEDRDFFADPKRFPVGVRVHHGALDEAASKLGVGREDLAIVCTRGHKEDLGCVRSLLDRRPAYLGLLGSRRKLREFGHVLESEGGDPGAIAAVRCPVGLDLGAETPEEIALAVVSEIVAFLHGRPLGSR